MKLTQLEINRGIGATLHHGFGAVSPAPPELAVAKKNWKKLRTFLASCDLDVYDGHTPIRSFAPKSRLTVRSTTLLHPFDFIFYTALVIGGDPRWHQTAQDEITILNAMLGIHGATRKGASSTRGCRR